MARAAQEPHARAERARLAEQERKAARKTRSADLVACYGQENAARVEAKELWLGAPEAAVVEMFGKPDATEVKALKTKTRRVLTYASKCRNCDGEGYRPEYMHIDDGKCYACDGKGKGSSGFALRVRIEDDAVVGWDEK